ncbi:BH3 interacting domain death agonist isoform X2 [Boleophthalmus pectinirostris]|uniref:BH3 interacting domain death agonist isoform X2 n=1 Tax=Boleophthalmus pectinirostris TaxID=150288 RepID=UPI00242E760A|nr:BH3 interacting domain death agonist isoform X2 [Boleophthalmus pectinirostris]
MRGALCLQVDLTFSFRMGDNGSLSRAQCSVLFWTFLQADSGDCPPEYRKELLSLRAKGFKGTGASLPVLHCGDVDSDGDLETDGHLSSNLRIAFEGMEASLDENGPENIQQVAAEIREIAANLELNVVAHATGNLTRNLLGSSIDHWKDHLHREVQHILAHGVGLDNLQQERVVAALTFTLVKGVCLQAPWLLRGLFHTTLQYLSSTGGK